MDPVLAVILFIVALPVANLVLSSLAEGLVEYIGHKLFIRKELKRRAKFTKSASV
jgi:hypothetical protein